MKQWKENPYRYPLLSALFMTAVGISAQNDICGYGRPWWELLLMAFAVCAVYLGCAVWKARFAGILAGTAAAVLLVSAAAGWGDVLREGCETFVRWYFAAEGAGNAGTYRTALVFTAACLCGLAFVSVRFEWIQRLFAAAVFALLAGNLFAGLPVCAKTAVLGFLYLFLTGIDLCQKHAEHQESGVRKRIVLTLLPVLLLAGVLLAAAPKPEEPYDWEFAKTIGRMVRTCAERVSRRIQFYAGGDSDVFSLQFTGYSESAQTGGPVEKSDRTDMTVTLRSAAKGNLYLAGSIWDTFDGTSWSAQAKPAPEEPDYFGDNVESGEDAAELCARTRMTVTFDEVYTRTVFWPEQTEKLDIEEEKLIREANRVRLVRPRGSGYSYTAVWRQFNLGSEKWDAFVRRMQEQPRREDAYTEYVYETYLTDPQMSAAVRSYLEEAVSGAEDRYGQLQAAKELLRQYTYTRTPEAPKEGTDFLEEFLLRSKEGYCTYFATAFTLIARSLGYPARYVEGYCVPALGVPAGRSVEVKSEYAHAWTEVWLDGIGWVVFEPTPSYGEMCETPWTTEAKPVRPAAPAVPEDTPEEETGEQMPEEAAGAKEQKEIWMVLCACAAVLLAAGTALALAELARHLRMQKASEEERFARQICACEYLLTQAGLSREPWETLTRYSSRISRLPEIGELAAQVPFAEYEALCYGQIPAEGTVSERTCAAAAALYAYHRLHSGRGKTIRMWVHLRYGRLRGRG